jgi:hypothetical protein
MPIVAMLNKESHAEVIREATATLGRIGTPDAIQSLAAFAEPSHRLLGIGGRPVEHKVWAVEGLALSGSGAVGALRSLAREGETAVQEAAQAALSEIGG